MIIDDKKVEVNPLSDMADGSFSIDNTAFIFDILRNKMYGNVPLAICREYISNAYDANVEAGNGNKPITISLPTNDDLYLKIKDEGPGISEDRIFNVFLKYGNSTKRKTNDQVGSFGIGAKVAFAYSDSFSILTVVDGIKYNYNCFIDDTQIGKIILLSKTETNDSNGTEIIIPIQRVDNSKFTESVYFISKHFDITPVIKPIFYTQNKPIPSCNGTDWFLTSKNEYNTNYYYSNNSLTVKIILGQLEYDLVGTTLPEQSDSKIRSLRGTLYLKFNIGDLNISSSREHLASDKLNISKIKERYDLFKKEYFEQIDTAISNNLDYIDAHTYVHDKLLTDFPNLINLNNLDLGYDGRAIKAESIYGNYKIGFGCFEVINNDLYKKDSYFNLSKDYEYYFNDTEKVINNKNIKKLFLNEDKTLDKSKKVCIINFSSKLYDEEELKHLGIPTDLIEINKLSEYIDGTARKSSIRTVIYKLTTHGFSSTNIKDFENDKNKKAFCSFKKQYNEKVVEINKKLITDKKLFSLDGYSVYAYELKDGANQEKLDKIFKGCEKYEDVLNSKYDKNEHMALSYIMDTYKFHNLYELERTLPKLLNNDLIDLFNIQLELREKTRRIDYTFFDRYNMEANKEAYDKYLIANPKFNIEKLEELKTNITNKFSLLRYVNIYNCLNDKQAEQDLIDYLNKP